MLTHYWNADGSLSLFFERNGKQCKTTLLGEELGRLRYILAQGRPPAEIAEPDENILAGNRVAGTKTVGPGW